MGWYFLLKKFPSEILTGQTSERELTLTNGGTKDYPLLILSFKFGLFSSFRTALEAGSR